MLNMLVETKMAEGTTIFSENGNIFLIIDTVYGYFNMYHGVEAVKRFRSYDITNLVANAIAESNGITIYFIRA